MLSSNWKPIYSSYSNAISLVPGHALDTFLYFSPSAPEAQINHIWWGQGNWTCKLQPSERATTVKTGMQAVGQDSDSTQILQKLQLLRGAPPQLLQEYFSSRGVAQCGLGWDPSSCFLVLPELLWILLRWMMLMKTSACSCLFSELLYWSSNS